MSKAGPLTRSRSKRVNPIEPAPGLQDRPSLLNTPSLDVKEPPHEDLGRILYSDEIVIGLALGSPGQSPLPHLPPNDGDVDISYRRDVPEDTPGDLGTGTEIGNGGQDRKGKGSKWKSIGSLFGKKDSSTRVPVVPPFYQLDRIPGSAPAKEHVHENHQEANAVRRKRADSSRSKTGTDSSQSTAKGDSRGLLRRNSSRRKGLRRRKVEEASPEASRLHDALPAHPELENFQPRPSALRQPTAPLLQVEIPNVELGRYSVMFGDLLGTNPPSRSQPKKQSPPFSCRREYVGEQVTSIAAEDAHQPLLDGPPKLPHARDDSTSSKSSKTPSFSLFPSSPPTPRQSVNSTVNKSLPKPSPLGRSTTAPNTLAPPDRPQLHKSKSDDHDHVLVFVHGPADLPSAPNSHRDMNSSKTLGISNQKLEVDPLAPASKDAREIFDSRAFPARKSSRKKLPQPTEEARLASYPMSEPLGAAAEISIARQISISRRQRQLLVPVAPKLARQPMQPTLVKGVSTPAARKSHHLTLEDA